MNGTLGIFKEDAATFRIDFVGALDYRGYDSGDFGWVILFFEGQCQVGGKYLDERLFRRVGHNCEVHSRQQPVGEACANPTF